MDFLKIVNETEEEFEKIAHMLFNNYAIQTHNALFRFVEIEFYWHSPNHIDTCTYPRIHVDPKNGDWYFHYSGVDIALKDEGLKGYGGILIRKIYDLNEMKTIKGPMICRMKLFSETNAFSESISTKIIPYPRLAESKIERGTRIGIKEDNREYRFFINP